MKRLIHISCLYLLLTVCPSIAAQGQYWNTGTCLETFRLAPPPEGYHPQIIDLNADGKPDGIISVTNGDVPVLWLDDDANMSENDTEGDMINDCVLIDRNKDGEYDFIVKWADLDDDGKADLQLVAEYPFEKKQEVWPYGLYMYVFDTDKDGIFNYIDWNKLRVESWRKYGISDFFPDYSGKSMFLKMHTATYQIDDLRKNWENPFLFYDPDNDGLSEMAIRLLDSPPYMKDKSTPNLKDNFQLTGNIDWVSMAYDLDNDNGPRNEFDFDFTLGYSGKGFDYTDQVHKLKNMRGLPEADKFFPDPRFRELTELLYADHDSARELIFQRGDWQKAFFVYDEDDDCARWERVEFCDNADPFIAGRSKGGFDNHTQSDPAGDRGEWDDDFSGGGKLYVGKFDGRLHLYGADNGLWRIDQTASFYQGWDRQWQRKDPTTFATIHYSDANGNGFIDTIEYDLDSDKQYETRISLDELGISDECQLLDPQWMDYRDYSALFSRMASSMWRNAMKAVEVARMNGLPVQSYSKLMNAADNREKYDKGWWLGFYVYNDLLHHFISNGDKKSSEAVTKAYFSGDWSPLLPLGEGVCKTKDPSHSFYTPEDLAAINQSARTEWGRQIISRMERMVDERRSHDLTVPIYEAGHGHFYVCPIHNQTFSFRWEHPTEHLCKACGKEWSGVNRYDWGWANFVHEGNKKYMQACSYLYIATGKTEYAMMVRDMLMDYAGRYPGWMVHDVNRRYTEAHSGKMFGQSLDEAVWFCIVTRAYDAVRGAIDENDCAFIEKNLFNEGAGMLLRRRDFGNWQVWHNAALASLGVILGDDSIIDTALNDKECGYHYLFNKHVHNDGWWNEGSPIYHFYPLEAMVYTAEAVRCRGINLYDEKLYNMFDSPLRGTYCNLCFPSHNDGWYGESLMAQAGLYELMSVRYNEPEFREVLAQSYRNSRRTSEMALFNPVEIKPAEEGYEQGSWRFSDAGFALLRSKKTTVVMKYGPHGGGHGHPDKLSISIHDGKNELVSDFGTPAYGAPDYTRWYRKTLAHNTVCVDGRDQASVAGQFIDFKATKNGGYIKASSDSSYAGVRMEREMALKGNVLSDTFICSSEERHRYEYVLLFNTVPDFVGKKCLGTIEWQDEPYRQIHDVKEFEGGKDLKIEIEGAEIEISAKTAFQVFTGAASGIPPTNPGVKTISGSESRPVIQCYPVIIRTNEKNMNISATWRFKQQ